MKKLLLFMVLFIACSTPEDRLEIVNLTNPDELLWRNRVKYQDQQEIFVTLKDSCIYITIIQSDGDFDYHQKIYCFKNNSN